MLILIAEDEPVSCTVLKKFLSQYGPCTVVADGQQAVLEVKAAYERKQGYELVCMDLHMPVMNGHEAIREIRQYERANGILRPTRIFVTTALDDMASVTEALLGKCTAYLMKPIDLNILRQELQAVGLTK
jgi:two-component system chemotaxis response regulator CheY